MKDNTKSNLSFGLVTAGLLAIMTASALPLLHLATGIFGYIYAAGALMLLAGRIAGMPPRTTPLRLRRLMRMEVWTALVFMAGAALILLPQARGNDWLAFTLAGGVLTLYTSIMIPRERAKGNR